MICQPTETDREKAHRTKGSFICTYSFVRDCGIWSVWVKSSCDNRTKSFDVSGGKVFRCYGQTQKEAQANAERIIRLLVADGERAV